MIQHNDVKEAYLTHESAAKHEFTERRIACNVPVWTSGTLQVFGQMSKGLFHKAIAQSGNGFAYWGWQPKYYKPMDFALRLAEQLQCRDTDAENLLKCLRGIIPTRQAYHACSSVATTCKIAS